MSLRTFKEAVKEKYPKAIVRAGQTGYKVYTSNKLFADFLGFGGTIGGAWHSARNYILKNQNNNIK
jgi:hypothetical protein